MFGLGGGGFGSARRFQESFRCHSVSLLAAEQQRDVSQLEYSDKIILPPSCLEKLAQLDIQYPMMFEVVNPRSAQHRLHCGVLEFVAQEGMVYLPYWMMENMNLNEGDIIHLRSATLRKGSYVKLQPQTTDFIKVSNPKAVLEQSLRHFSALTKGETFRIFYNKRKYDIGVVEVRAHGGPFPPGAPPAVCIIETDLELDFDAPADYVEPQRPSPPSSSPLSSSPLEKSPVLNPMGEPDLDCDSDEDMDAKPKFSGSGFRLDGKAIKQPKSSPSGGSMLGGAAPVSVGVRIGPSGELVSGGQTLGGGSGQTLGGGQALGGGLSGVGHSFSSQAAFSRAATVGGLATGGGNKLGGGQALGGSGQDRPADYWARFEGGNRLG